MDRIMSDFNTQVMMQIMIIFIIEKSKTLFGFHKTIPHFVKLFSLQFFFLKTCQIGLQLTIICIID